MCRRRDDDAALFGQKVRYGKIAFARVVVEAEHPASRWEFRQFLGNGRKSRARRNANQHSFFVCRTQRHFLCIGGGSEELRGGKECGSTCGSRWSTDL